MAGLRGAFIVFAAPIPVPTDVIAFQFNSELLTRRLEPNTGSAATPAASPTERGGGGPAHVPGPPKETYQLTIELDASDQLAAADPIAGVVGVHPAIAQLELLLYPSSSLLILNRVLARAGSSIVTPAELPLVLFAWGAPRVLPVQIASMTVTEQQFDDRLNPLQAKVELSLTVLGEQDLARRGEPFTTLATVMHVAKEGLSRLGTGRSIAAIAGAVPF